MLHASFELFQTFVEVLVEKLVMLLRPWNHVHSHLFAILTLRLHIQSSAYSMASIIIIISSCIYLKREHGYTLKKERDKSLMKKKREQKL